jgi:hypothetical protein
MDETRSKDCKHTKGTQNLGRRDHTVDMVMFGGTISQWVLKKENGMVCSGLSSSLQWEAEDSRDHDTEYSAQ